MKQSDKALRKPRCRHERNCWIIAGGRFAWCFVCGALRELEIVPGTTQSRPFSKWIKPTGNTEINPYNRLAKR